MTMTDAIVWLADKIEAFLESTQEVPVPEVLDLVQKGLNDIMQEWHDLYPGFELLKGLTFGEFRVNKGEEDIITLTMVYKFTQPKWKTQFTDLHPLGLYEGHEIYNHYGHTLAYYADNKYLVCSGLSAHQTALEISLATDRMALELQKKLGPLHAIGI